MTSSPLSTDEPSSSGFSSSRALVTGSVALGAVLTGAVLRRIRRQRRPAPEDLPPALQAEVRTSELMEGRVRYYARPGGGVPIVLLHSINAAGSSFEMKPIFDHLAAATHRPLYALDWLGFGRSDRPPVAYRPELYQRQLRRFLSEHLREPADLVALSLAAEYAAAVASDAPFLVRKLVLISPTGLDADLSRSALVRHLVGLSDRVGVFELAFDRLTRPASLRRFYAEQVFLDGRLVPDELVHYAHVTAGARGAHHAPRRFVAGQLFMGEAAWEAYVRLAVPTQIFTPRDAASTVQRFDRLPDLVHRNVDVRARTMPTGLLPHWEAPGLLLPALSDFLT
ncbi:MAG: alpha/beta fold hydrolase [Bacteroidetes bacterium]|nr:MAG: alpha/beta fold hydrolase [Bacteroidota bacterium]